MDLYLLSFAIVALALAIIDLRQEILPDMLTFGLAVLGAARAVLGDGPTLIEATLGAILGGGLLWVVRAAYQAMRGEEGLGFGDVKLAAALGLWTGVIAVGWVVVGAALLGLIAAALTRRRRLPFGPALLLSAWGGLLIPDLGATP